MVSSLGGRICGFFLLLATSYCAVAQEEMDSAFVTVVVSDTLGGAIPNARVRILERSSGNEKDQVTGETGNATVKLQSGTFDLSVTSPGFVVSMMRGVKVKPGEHQRINVVLKVLVYDCCIDFVDPVEAIEPEKAKLGELKEPTERIASPTPVENSQIQIKTEDHSCEGQSDWETPACQSAWQTNISVVFLGLATDVRQEDVPIILDGKNEHTMRLQVTFQVNESFIGVPEKVVTVTSGGDLCGYPFSKGHKYLVYGRRLGNGEVYVSISSSTKWAKDAANDLKYLRGLPMAPHGATIHGTVFRFTGPENPRTMSIRRAIPEVGQKVEIHGTSQNYDTTVDSHGNFKITGLPPGRYAVLLKSDGEVYTSQPLKSTTVDVADKGCARFFFWIDPFVKNKSENNEDRQHAPPTQNPKAEDHP
jgi:hypothetical protein